MRNLIEKFQETNEEMKKLLEIDRDITKGLKDCVKQVEQMNKMLEEFNREKKLF